MNYSQACYKVECLAKQYGYKATSIEFHNLRSGKGRYVARAKNSQGIPVLLAFSSSYKNMATETEEYLRTVNN